MRLIKSGLLAGVCTACVLGYAPLALAQDGIADTGQSDEGQRRLGAITVTAQKKEEALQSAPLAVSAFDTEALELKQIEGPQQLQFSVPSLVFAQLTGYTQLSMRGIGSDLTVTAGGYISGRRVCRPAVCPSCAKLRSGTN